MSNYTAPFTAAEVDAALTDAQTALQPEGALELAETNQVENAAVAAVENLPTTRQPRTWYLRLATPPSLVVATNLYPVEATEQLASAARLLSAAAFRGIVENINTTALLTLGSVVNTLVPYTLEPEEIDTTAILTYGSIFSTLTTITLDPDNMDTTAILTFGSIEDTLVIYTHPSNDEKITSVGTLLSAIFE